MESGRHVPEARQVGTTTASEASPGIQETTDAVREDLPFRERPPHTAGWEAVVALTPDETPIHRPLMFMSPAVHQAATDRDGGRGPRHRREDRIQRLVHERDGMHSGREALTDKLRVEVDESDGLQSHLGVLGKSGSRIAH